MNIIHFGLLLLDENKRVIFFDPFVQKLGEIPKITGTPFSYKKLFFSNEIEKLFKTSPNQTVIVLKERKIHISFRFININNHDNYFFFFQDLTNLDKMFLQINENEHLLTDLETIFDTSFEVLYVSDGFGKTLRVSAACERLWGVKPEKLIGQNVDDLEKQGIFSPSITRLVLSRKCAVRSFQTTKNGRRLFVVGSPIFNEKGKIIKVVNASKDVTEINILKNEHRKLRETLLRYQQELIALRNTKSSNHKIIHRSKEMAELLELSHRVASFDSTVLLLGETGVGKEVIAREIHRVSERSKKPLIKINCGAIPESLFESELFGYQKGAFTGAQSQGKLGLLEMANLGTLFLDEITELPLPLQSKLLHILQKGEFFSIGGVREKRVDIRVIAATNQNISFLVKEGKFREDLFYRLNVVTILIPPLRNRVDDIVPLGTYFLNKFNKEHAQSKRLSPEVFDLFISYNWPGNVRELENTIERLVVTVQDPIIYKNSLPEQIKYNKQTSNALSIYDNAPTSLKKATAIFEANLIENTIKHYGSVDAATKILKISQPTVSRKLAKAKNFNFQHR